MVEYFDYKVSKPDQSEIEIKKGFTNIVGYFVWNIQTHKYDYKGKESISEEELKEVLKSINSLNKKTILPKWLSWK
jgi:hypothetical protein